ncbi:hypothetical protein [Pseudomonas sp.]|jgi:hypothetical protein|uniref:hypothetical protein n=1 Tax=Pseudomonas sp. TaxID=306 RepID=UPI0028A861CB|nr:hypothetical protein [Pseudomonas sp.]
MHALKHYLVSYRINGQDASLEMQEFEEPSLDQVRLRLMRKHQAEPQVTTDGPWEDPVCDSEYSRIAELGISDIHITPKT